MLVAKSLDMQRSLGVEGRPIGAALGSNPFPGPRPVASIDVYQALYRHEKPSDSPVCDWRMVQRPR